MVLDQQSGVLIEPENPQALADAVDQLLANPEKMRAMGQFAKQRAERLFSAERCAQQYLNMYHIALEKQCG